MEEEIIDKNIQKQYDDYNNGFFIRLAREAIASNYNIAGLFPFKGVPADKATIVQQAPIDKFVDQITGKLRPLAKGARARRLRGTTVSPSGLQLTYSEFEYEIDWDDLKDPSINLGTEIESMSYLASLEINDIILEVVRNNAQKIVDPKIKGNWEDPGTEFKQIARDIRRLKDLTKSYKLDLVAMGDDAKFELDTKSAIETLPYQIPKTGFNLEDNISTMGMNNFAGGSGMGLGELFVFPSLTPAVNIRFQEFDNSNVQNAGIAPELAKFAPPIKMLLFDNSDEEIKPTTTIKMGYAVGAFPARKGKAMFQLADILQEL